MFALVWIAWLNGSPHHELHGHEDARGRSMFLLQILVLVPLGAFIPGAGDARGVAFAVDAGVLFAVLALLWLLASRGDTAEFRRPSMLYVTGTAACAVVLAASAALPADARVLTWGAPAVVYLVGFVVIIGRAIPEQVVALSVTDALTERFGLFIIIVLGENVTGVVDGLAHEPTNALTLAVGLVVGFGAWWTYFDFAGHRLPRPTRAPCSGWWSTCRSRPRWPPWAPRWSASSSTPTTAGPPRPRPGCSARARASCAARRWCSRPPRARGARTSGSRLYRPLARTCAAMAVLCVGVGALRPAPLVLGLALVLLFGIPWGVAVANRVADYEEPAI
ncbi:low temperature requirement protein A [Streptomyces sp. NPDC101455]|uniref:low temperature requirement protein A n=1 Tax=Streptomyces sp. NPDC101455 TaxID=3366142 RepID=UPI0037F9C513